MDVKVGDQVYLSGQEDHCGHHPRREGERYELGAIDSKGDCAEEGSIRECDAPGRRRLRRRRIGGLRSKNTGIEASGLSRPRQAHQDGDTFKLTDVQMVTEDLDL